MDVLIPIIETDEFQTNKIIEKTDKTSQTVLKSKKSKREITVLGKDLEAQYLVNDHYLILVTEGNPFEEALYLYYFNADLKLLDSLELSAMYAQGIFTNSLITNDYEIQFSFFKEGERWVLTILPHPRYAIFSNRFPVKKNVSRFQKNWLILKKT